MTSNKPNPPIDLSRAKEPPTVLNLDAPTDTVDADGNQNRDINTDDLIHEQERSEKAEKVAARQMTIAHCYGSDVS